MKDSGRELEREKYSIKDRERGQNDCIEDRSNDTEQSHATLKRALKGACAQTKSTCSCCRPQDSNVYRSGFGMKSMHGLST